MLITNTNDAIYYLIYYSHIASEVISAPVIVINFGNIVAGVGIGPTTSWL